jgi:prophage regulatory protein
MRMLGRQQVADKVGFRKSKIYELLKEGLFPAPIKLAPGSNRNGWLESEIDAWIAKRISDHRNLSPAE